MTPLRTGKHRQPTPAVTSRRHPLAFAAYFLVLVLGLVFVFQLFGTNQTEKALFPDISPWLIRLWEWEMVLGAIASLTGLLGKPRVSSGWPDLADLLHVEGIGALLQGFGMTTYLAAAMSVYVEMHHPLRDSIPGLLIYLGIITGLFVRGIQALRDARRMEKLGLLLAVLDPETDDES